ncbi:hypothetical protein U1Q18_039143 [Sarracenia purpurea var. burkii]
MATLLPPVKPANQCRLRTGLTSGSPSAPSLFVIFLLKPLCASQTSSVFQSAAISDQGPKKIAPATTCGVSRKPSVTAATVVAVPALDLNFQRLCRNHRL